ncbi:YkvA family protein [Salinicola endophyticus]|uniref:YkvA family protein n=1 Tax=Salinicola endophyticus TaxID=1949083 RepID=UPI000DA24971|nr:YkvA family protein [Salinicola endophyticus]
MPRLPRFTHTPPAAEPSTPAATQDTPPPVTAADAVVIEHAEAYSDTRFWRKLARFGSRAGRGVALKSLQLYFVLKRPDVPIWAKSTIIGALGYFISPLDAIPDVIAGVGFTDDASVLAAALVAVSIYIDEEVERQAAAVLARWWPESSESPPA